MEQPRVDLIKEFENVNFRNKAKAVFGLVVEDDDVTRIADNDDLDYNPAVYKLAEAHLLIGRLADDMARPFWPFESSREKNDALRNEDSYVAVLKEGELFRIRNAIRDMAKAKNLLESVKARFWEVAGKGPDEEAEIKRLSFIFQKLEIVNEEELKKLVWQSSHVVPVPDAPVPDARAPQQTPSAHYSSTAGARDKMRKAVAEAAGKLKSFRSDVKKAFGEKHKYLFECMYEANRLLNKFASLTQNPILGENLNNQWRVLYTTDLNADKGDEDFKATSDFYRSNADFLDSHTFKALSAAHVEAKEMGEELTSLKTKIENCKANFEDTEEDLNRLCEYFTSSIDIKLQEIAKMNKDAEEFSLFERIEVKERKENGHRGVGSVLLIMTAVALTLVAQAVIALIQAAYFDAHNELSGSTPSMG